MAYVDYKDTNRYDSKIIRKDDWQLIVEDVDIVAGDSFTGELFDVSDVNTPIETFIGVVSVPDKKVTFTLNSTQTEAMTAGMNGVYVIDLNGNKYMWGLIPIYDK